MTGSQGGLRFQGRAWGSSKGPRETESLSAAARPQLVPDPPWGLRGTAGTWEGPDSAKGKAVTAFSLGLLPPSVTQH